MKLPEIQTCLYSGAVMSTAMHLDPDTVNRFAKTGDPQALADLIEQATGAEVVSITTPDGTVIAGSQVQLRNHEGDTWLVNTVKEAFEAAEQDPEIWKISWQEGEHRIRLVRYDIEGNPHWLYDPHKRYIEAVVSGKLSVLRSSAPSTHSEDTASDTESDQTK